MCEQGLSGIETHTGFCVIVILHQFKYFNTYMDILLIADWIRLQCGDG